VGSGGSGAVDTLLISSTMLLIVKADAVCVRRLRSVLNQRCLSLS
jgi:hypothetical protein